MNKHISSSELKARAKSQLFGKYGTLIPAILVAETITLSLSSLISIPLGTQSTLGLVIQLIIEFVLQLFASILLVGQLYMYLNVACGGNISIGDVFFGFKNHPNKIILIQLIQMLLMLACFIPCFICLGLYMSMESSLLLIPLSITFCFGLAAGTIVALQYSQSFFILLDFPELSAVQCLKFSREIMKGNKARRFYLEVSFLPIMLLGILSCCIGLLFLTPYMNTTYTNFYLELMSFRNRQNKEQPFQE